jgi:hypothetical protein
LDAPIVARRVTRKVFSSGNSAAARCSILILMRRILAIVLAFTLVLDGAGAAYSATVASKTMEMDPMAVAGEVPPCHDDSAMSDRSGPSASSPHTVPDCCQTETCLCSLATCFVASVGIADTGSAQPQHQYSRSDLEHGHPLTALNLLLRPPTS